MADYTFPAGDLDRPTLLLNLLGSFWANTYAARDQVKSYAAARGQVEKQTERDLLELVASVSRFEVPIFHKDYWYPLRLLESDRNDAQTSLLQYDDDAVNAVFDGTYQYSVPRERVMFAFPLPAKLRDAPLIMNRITNPSWTLTRDIDFTLDIDNAAIVFREDPFEDERIAVSSVFEDGVAVDREALLWVFSGDFDFDRIYQQFAYVLGMRLRSSRGYRELMNALFDGIIGGAGKRTLLLAFQAMTGITLTQDETETIEVVDTDAEHLIIATDANVYRYNLDATATVSVGDVVQQGDPLIDGLELIELNEGLTPDNLDALALGRGMLAYGFLGDLVFENKDVPLEVTEASNHASGYTFVKWGLGGFELDVEKFFDDLHANGVAADQTVAMLLDQRDADKQSGQPVAANLPSTINPLEFLVENVLRNNAFVVRVRASEQTDAGVGLHNVRFLRKIIQPHTAMLLVIELSAAEESVTIDLVSEAPGLFTAMEPLVESIDGEVFVKDDRRRLQVVSNACQ